MTPTEASLPKNQDIVHQNLFPEGPQPPTKPKYNTGDLVRISHQDEVFRRGYEAGFTNEIFEISEVLSTNPPTYKLKDLKGEDVTSSFYEQELSKVVVPTKQVVDKK